MKRSDGFALIETIVLGFVMLIPLMWLLGVLSDLQRGALAASAAAREAGAGAARAADPAEMDSVVATAVADAFRDHGLDPRRADVEVDLGGSARGAAVEVVVRYDVTVLQAPFIGPVGGPSIQVSAAHVARIDPYASRP
ncbi:MAG: hypothetical protein ACRDLB_04510 [Actinomycetota bacterium]